ncbi:MAG: carboxypeptidase-like regulatory domain-containing protein [Planctomycetota bacterium]
MHIRSRKVSPLAIAALVVAVAIAAFYAVTPGERESTAIPLREHSIPDRATPPQARDTQVDLPRDDTSATSIPTVVSDSEYRGEVVDIEDDPVSNALILLLNMGSRTLADRRSDAAGSFSFASLVDESFELVIEHPDYQVAAYAVSSRAELPARIVLEQGASLFVTVKCADAAALPEDLEVSVHCDPSVRPLRLQRTADAITGEYKFFGLPELPVSVSVFAPGYPTPSPRSVEMVIGGTVECSFLLPGLDALQVRVVDARNSPISGAKLLLSRSGPRGSADFAITDEFGMSFLNAVSVGSTLKVSAEGFAAQGVAIADSESELVVRLEPESIIDIVVLDAVGAPAEDVTVSCTSNARALPHYLDAKALIRILDGACRLDGLAAGSYELSFSRDRKRLGSLRVELDHGEVERAEFVAAAFENFEGIVLRNGRPAGAGRLRSSDNEVIEVDNAGRFTLAAPSPLTIAPETWFAYSQGEGEFSHLRMQSQEGRLELSFETRRLHGQVVAPSGEAVPGLFGVLYFRFDTSNSVTVRTSDTNLVTDELGRFDVELMRGQHECEFPQLPSQFAYFPTPIELSVDREVRLQLQAADTLSLRAFGRDGRELTGLEVEAVGEALFRRQSAIAATTGSYYWPAWAQRGVVRSAGYVPREFDLGGLPRGAPIRVELALGGIVHFQGRSLHSYLGLEIDRLEGEALPAVLRTVRLEKYGSGSATLPAGRYQVKTSDLSGKTIATEFEVIAGKTTDVELP